MEKGRTEAAESGGRETAASRAIAGSLHCPLSGIGIPSRPSNICLEAEEQEEMILTSESEVASEEEVKVEDCRRFFRPCRWINRPFTRLRGFMEGAVADAKSFIIQNGQ